jgi:hypothetical protein
VSDALQSKRVVAGGSAWCKKAAELVDAPKVKKFEAANFARQLENIFDGNPPLGMQPGKWDELKERFKKLRQDSAISLNPKQGQANVVKGDFDAYLEGAKPELEKLVKKLEDDAKEYNKLKLRIDALGLSRTGLSRLMLAPDRPGAVDALEDLQTRMAEADSRGTHTVNPSWWPLPDAVALNADLTRAIQQLDLKSAERCVSVFEKLVAEAVAETREVAKLEGDLVGQPGAPAAGDLAGWRNLNAIEAEFQRVGEACEDAIAQAEAIAGNPRSLQQRSKEQQLGALRPGLQNALDSWKDRPIATKIAEGLNGGREQDAGSLAFLRAKCSALLAPTGISREEQERIKQEREWQRVEADIIRKYDDYALDFFDLSKRGADLPRALRTDYVASRFAPMGKTYSIGGRNYTVGPSDTAGVALKTPIPAPYPVNAAGQEVRSFIYHR